MAAGTLSVAENYPTSKVRDSSPECQAAMAQEWPGGSTLRPSSGAAAEWSYPMSEVSSGQEETPHVRGQGSGWEELPSVPGQWWPGEATSCLRPGAVTLRSHPEPEARGGSREKPPTAEARAEGWRSNVRKGG